MIIIIGGVLIMKKRFIVMGTCMMFALGIGPASPQEVLAATSEPYIEMTVEMTTISKHETNLVKVWCVVYDALVKFFCMHFLSELL